MIERETKPKIGTRYLQLTYQKKRLRFSEYIKNSHKPVGKQQTIQLKMLVGV